MNLDKSLSILHQQIATSVVIQIQLIDQSVIRDCFLRAVK